MKKGIIMEINDRVLTLLTPEGEFLQAQKQDLPYEIGQEIHFFPIYMEERKKFSVWFFLKAFKGKSIAVAALGFVIAFTSFFSIYNNNEVYAYMSIDVNPSIELGVNEKLQVVKLSSYNESGTTLIGELGNWKKEDINLVLERILLEAKEAGYMKARNNVLIGTVRTGESSYSIDEKLEQTLEKVEEKIEKEGTVLVLVDATNEERELAKDNGQTVGNYVKQKQESLIQNEREAPVTKDKDQDPSEQAKQKGKKENQSIEQIQPPSNQLEKKEENSKSQSESNARNKKEQPSKEKREESIEGNNKSQPTGGQNKKKESENQGRQNRTDANSSKEQGQNKVK